MSAPSNSTIKDARKTGWYHIDNEIMDVYAPALGVYGIAVYNLIARHADRTGGAFPSYQYIADRLNISRPKAVSTVKKLVEIGLVRKEFRTDSVGDLTSNQYTLIDVNEAHRVVNDIYHPVNVINHGSKPRLLRVVNDVNPNNTQSEQDTIKKTKAVKTNQTVVSSLITRGEPSPSQNGSVGLADDLPALDSFSVSEEEANSNRDQDIPPIAANADEQSLSAAPTAPSGLTPVQAMAYAMLTDPEVGVGERDALAWVRDRDSKLLDLIRHVAVWWSDRYLRKTVDGVGALESRIRRGCSPNRWPDAFNESKLYQRHYPLTKVEAEARDRARTYTGKAPPHPLGKLLDALPVPLWEEEPPC